MILPVWILACVVNVGAWCSNGYHGPALADAASCQRFLDAKAERERPYFKCVQVNIVK